MRREHVCIDSSVADATPKYFPALKSRAKFNCRYAAKITAVLLWFSHQLLFRAALVSNG